MLIVWLNIGNYGSYMKQRYVASFMNEQIGAKLHISVKFVVVIDKIVDKNVTALTISILDLNDGNLEMSVLSAPLLVLLIPNRTFSIIG